MAKISKEEKYRQQFERERQKRIAKFHRMARVQKNATEEQINAQIISYVAKMKKDCYKVSLTTSQCNDAEFLMALYQANPEMLIFQKPSSDNVQLQNNLDFMLEFVKMAHAYNMKGYADGNEKYWYATKLRWLLQHYKTAMSNPAFIERLAKVYGEVNIIEVIEDALKSHCVSIDKQRDKAESENIDRVISSLSTELLCDQARKFGRETIKYVPREVPHFNEIVSAGIEKDNFDSLTQLPAKQVADNIDLVIKAYELGGIAKLSEYVRFSLTPHRTRWYMCHGEPHDYDYYDRDFAVAQDAVMNDERIKQIIMSEKQKVEENARQTQPKEIKHSPSSQKLVDSILKR